MAEEQEEEPQIACTIKMKSISSFFKSPVAVPDKKIQTKPREYASSAKTGTDAGDCAKQEKCRNGNRSKCVEKRRVNGLLVGCKGDSNETPGDCVSELKSDRQKASFGKKRNTDCLNSSLDEFQTPPKPVHRTKKRSQKPNCKLKADVSSSQSGKSKKKAKISEVTDEYDSKEVSESVSEISYEDFLRESGNVSDDVIDKSGLADDTVQAEEESEDVNKCFTERKSAANNSVDDVRDKKESRKLRARQNRAAKETRKPSTSECELTDDEKPKAPVANIMNYFAASSRNSDVKVKSSDDVVVFIKAEVHCPPPSSDAKVFDIFSPKQRNPCVEDTPKVDQLENKTSTNSVAKTTARKRSSNVIVESADVDLSITELESPFVQEDPGKPSSPKVRIASSKQEKVKVASKGKKVAEDGNGSTGKKKTKVAESECTKKPTSNHAEDTSCKDGAVTDSTILQDITSNTTKCDKESDVTSDAATIESDALERRKSSAAVKIASLQSIDLPTGRSQTQMTLNYGHRKNDGSVLQKPLPLRKNKKVTRLRKRCDSKKVSGETSQVDVIAKDVKTGRRKKRLESNVSKSVCSSVSNDSGLVAVGTTPETGTVSVDVYESTIVETGCQKKKTPIKLKIKRIPRTSVGFEDPRKQQKKAKLSRAQQLLVRAKTKNGQKPTRFTSSRSCEGDALRRSSRRSSMAAKSAIMLCYEGAMWNEQQQTPGEATDKTKMPHSKRTGGKSETLMEKKESKSSVSKRNGVETPSKTLAGKTLPRGKVTLTSVPKGSTSKVRTKAPVKGSSGGTKQAETVSGCDSRKASKSATKMTEVDEKRKLTKKSSRAKGNQNAETTKLASIFHTPKTGRDSPVVVSDASNDGKEVNVERRQFLLSGVPQELQKRLVQTAEVDTVNNPLWPSVSHVQQAEICEGQEAVSDVVDVWNLPDGPLNVRQRKEDVTGLCVSGRWQSGSFMETLKSEDKVTSIMEARSRPTLSSETVSWLLAETMTHNASYPAVRMYQHLAKRRLVTEKVSSDSMTTLSNGTQENKTGCSKRKLENLSGEMSTSHKNKKSRSSRDHKVDLKSDHKGGHKGDDRGAHKGDRKGYHNVDHKGDHKRDHKVDHNDDSTTNGAKEKISGGISQQTTENRKSRPKPADEKTENKKKSGSESTTKEAEKVGNSTLWTDKYAPVTSTCVLGNPGCVGKLKTWLKEWKIVTDRQAKMEARERKKYQKKDGETKPAGNDDSDCWSDDDDFNLGGGRHGDSDGDEDLLCNTMVVTGPHGVGKTAMVYAVAHELGYKVFEVNASSHRSGKQVLAQLQEATQSHQVSKKNLPDLMSVMSKMAAVPPSSVKKETTKKKKLPTAFANLFAKAAKKSKSDDVSITSVEKAGGKKDKTHKRKENTSKSTCQSGDVTVTAVEKASGKKEKTHKRKENKGAVNKKSTSGNEGTKKAEAKRCDREMKNKKRSESESKKEKKPSTGLSDCSKQALDLSSTSVILFEEVDIVFEEDKGFWAAIQTFIETTKRPIILTSTIDQFIAAESERLTLAVPSLMNIASHLQTICLAESVRTDFSNLLSLVEYLHGDIRRCLLMLQFWVDSGGCANPVPKDVLFLSKHCRSVNQTDDNMQVKSVKDIAGQNHVKLKCDVGGSKVRSIDASQRNGIAEEGDISSVDSIPHSTAKSSTSADVQIDDAEQTLWATKPLLTSDGESESTTVLAHSAPPIHGRCFESVLGPSIGCHDDPLQDSVLQMLSDVGSSSSVRRGIRLVRHYRRQGIGLLYANLPRLLPSPASLPATDPDELPSELIKPPPKTDVAKTTYVDKLYDSERSDDEDGSEKAFLSLPIAKPVADSKSQLVAPSMHSCHKMCKRARELELLSLDCMSALHDDLSFLDSSFGTSSAGVMADDDTWGSHHRCRMFPGLSDDVGGAESEVSLNWWADICVEDVCSTVEMYSFKRTKETLSGILEEVDSLEELDRRLVSRNLWTPVAEQTCNPKIRRETDEEVRKCHCAHKASDNVVSHLPVGVQTHHRDVSMDYMPSIRTICRSEQFREASHVKRRFLHYLDQHQMALKPSSINELYSSFT